MRGRRSAPAGGGPAQDEFKHPSLCKGKLMEDDDTNVHPLNIPKNADEAASDKLIRQAPSIAKMRKALFDAYVAEGFTVDQAIKLVCM
jgi:hypothetical protein